MKLIIRRRTLLHRMRFSVKMVLLTWFKNRCKADQFCFCWCLFVDNCRCLLGRTCKCQLIPSMTKEAQCIHNVFVLQVWFFSSVNLKSYAEISSINLHQQRDECLQMFLHMLRDQEIDRAVILCSSFKTWQKISSYIYLCEFTQLCQEVQTATIFIFWLLVVNYWKWTLLVFSRLCCMQCASLDRIAYSKIQC